MKRIFFAYHLMLFFCFGLSAQNAKIQRNTLHAHIKFRQGYSQIDSSYSDNKTHLNRLVSLLDSTASDPQIRLKSLTIEGSASPEGYHNMNRRLSEKRARNMRAYIIDHTSISDSIIQTAPSDIDWQRLSELIAATDQPWRNKAIEIIAHTPIWVFEGKKIVDGRKKRLCRLQGGQAWEYMSKNFFPIMRNAQFRIICEQEIRSATDDHTTADNRIDNKFLNNKQPAGIKNDSTGTFLTSDTVPAKQAATMASTGKERKFRPLLKTNMLYDAIAIPNIGIEIPIGKDWSVGANWMYAWWSNDSRHRFWRIYGGDIELRRWFSARPRCGHHVGLYGQMLTYDIEWGKRGYLGDRWSWGIGLSYGYSLPIGKLFNIDFTLGIGYLNGDYMKYHPEDGRYLWESTHQQKWFGPTKAEVSLVWHIGRHSQQKGGSAR